jgi:bacterioferritin-associated ferredoxin
MCFHVPLSKLVKYYRFHQPGVASRFSECYGAGTGCGWCIPFLEQIFEKLELGEMPEIGMSPGEYSARRSAYRRDGHETLPGVIELKTNADLEDVIAEIPDDLKLDQEEDRDP